MTTQAEVKDNPRYIPVLDHGFVGLVDHMGDDAAICQAARVSYGAGTKSVNEDRGLLRYLMRHQHSTPFEQCSAKFHVKLPIFVARQLVRHRTASLNEYSGRYSEMTDEMYLPDLNRLQAQSKANKQGSGEQLSDDAKEGIDLTIINNSADCYNNYKDLLELGLTRELARIVLPVSNYTEWYWTINLHNLFRFLKLRMDSHAQWEIQEFARAKYELIKPLFPNACEAFEDYINGGATLSRMELNYIREQLGNKFNPTRMTELGMGKREVDEFCANFSIEETK